MNFLLIPLYFILTTMVYINQTSGTISIPKHTANYSPNGQYNLVVTSNMSNSVTLVNAGTDISTNTLYYKFELSNLESLNVGEYTYKLYELLSEETIETGLLTFGDYVRNDVVNNTFDNDKIQYNG